MTEKRASLYLITGFVLGVLIGLGYAWMFRPVKHVDTTPATLRADFKDQYRALIAAAYTANGDLVRAKARLDLLNDADSYRTLAGQAQRTLAEGGAPEEASALGLLAVALGQAPGPGSASTPQPTAGERPIAPETGAESGRPAPETDPNGLISGTTARPEDGAAGELASIATQGSGAAAPDPSSESPDADPPLTLQPSSDAPFILESRERTCDPELAAPLLQVQVHDDAGQPVPGVEVVVRWSGGEEHFFTGLKPELGLGYADFALEPGQIYTLQLVEGGEPVLDLSAPECEPADSGATGGESYAGGWALTFIQPQ